MKIRTGRKLGGWVFLVFSRDLAPIWEQPLLLLLFWHSSLAGRVPKTDESSGRPQSCSAAPPVSQLSEEVSGLPHPGLGDPYAAAYLRTRAAPRDSRSR